MRKKLKLLYIVEAMGGGVFTYLVELANALIRDYDIYIAYAVRPQTPQDYENYFDNSIHLIKIRNFVRSVNPINDIQAFFEIRNVAKKINPDIIHLHSSKAGVLGRWAFNGHKVSLFYTPHGYSFLMVNQSWIKRSVYKFIEKISAMRYCTTISCSEGEHRETLKLTKRATYINNGINMEKLQSLIDNVGEIADHKFTVFTMGRIFYQKNPTLFNEIAKAMPDVHFLWIGDGELRDKLTAQNIEITGWTERENALKKSLNADAFVLTSLWEGLPMSLLETMYMKKICVVSNVIGNHDVIKTGINGFVCDCISDYVKAIEVAKSGNGEDLALHAHIDIKQKYNTKTMSEQYKIVYDRN